MLFHTVFEKIMKYVQWSLNLYLFLTLSGPLLHAAEIITTPLSNTHSSVVDNRSSLAGMPISANPADPGSNGTLKSYPDNDGPSLFEPTAGQFRSFNGFAGNVALDPTFTASLDASVTEIEKANLLGLPRNETNGGFILQRAKIGGHLIQRSIDFKFGSVIPLPSEDENDTALLNPSAYYRSEPYLSGDETHESKGYYFSPHANTVYATQPGTIRITWRKAVSETSVPADAADASKWVYDQGKYFRLLEKTYTTSGTPIKPPQKIYWNAAGYQGPPVQLSASFIPEIKVVFNASVPETVSDGIIKEMEGLTTGEPSNLVYNKTLWRESDALFALNATGRVFVELLGELNSEGNRQHLGFEIVDIMKSSNPRDVNILIGEKVTVSDEDTGLDETSLYASYIAQGNDASGGFIKTVSRSADSKPEYYATNETLHYNDVQIIWHREGTLNIKWPFLHIRYRFNWPSDPADFSHYIRPAAGDKNEAKLTAVNIPHESNAVVEYQDPLDQQRAYLDGDLKFYTYLDSSQPQHRCLLSYNNNGVVSFERVFSWFEPHLNSGDLARSTQSMTVKVPARELGIWSAPPTHSSLESGLVAYWNFNEETELQKGSAFADLVGVYDGQPKGSKAIALEEGKSGFGRSIVLDPDKQQYVKIIGGSVDGLSFADGSMTLSSWFQVNGFNTKWQALIAQGEGSNWRLHRHKQTESLSFSGGNANTGEIASGLGSNVEDQLWHHVVAVADQANGTKLYIDGELVASNSSHSVLSSSKRRMRIGSNPNIKNNFWNGAIDDVALWDRALTNDEISQLYADDEGKQLLEFLKPREGVAQQVFGFAQVDSEGIATLATELDNDFLSDPLSGGPLLYQGLIAHVGERLTPPAQANLATGPYDYMAGFILPKSSDRYDPSAYLNPDSAGMESASMGAIIPVNIDPNNESIKVVWYRPSQANIPDIYWPAVEAHYTIQWPALSSEIIMARGDGSGDLDAYESKGTIYRQPDDSIAGYNPNEEHALIIGGRAYALRDDLNVDLLQADASTPYTSDPYVLVKYTAMDGRPAMSVFHVSREKPDQGILFDYVVEAGGMLQAPMPLPYLPVPISDTTGQPVTFYNSESMEDLPANWDALTADDRLSLDAYKRYTYQDRKGHHLVYRGSHDGVPALDAGAYDVLNHQWSDQSMIHVSEGEFFEWHLHATQRGAMVQMFFHEDYSPPNWLRISGGILEGRPYIDGNDVFNEDIQLTVVSLDGESNPIDLTVAITVEPDSNPVVTTETQGPLSIEHSGKLYTGRPPYLTLSADEDGTDAFKMNFYYQNQSTFDWPHFASQPDEDDVVPYLLPDGINRTAAASEQTDSLEIVYRPVWPTDVPVIELGDTLVEPKSGLPDVSGQVTLRLLYDQSIANSIDVTNGAYISSAVLYDPTRAKMADLQGDLPTSMNQHSMNGKVYFPDLPPHLSNRFYFDPAYKHDEVSGKLVFLGEYKKEIVGDSYLLPNILDSDEGNLLVQLASETDWRNAVADLTTSMVTYYRDPANPNLWKANEGSSSVVGYSSDTAAGTHLIASDEAAIITSDDQAVDSYALAIPGEGKGYLTLLANDGNNPSYEGLPITAYIIRVADTQENGEVKSIYSSNPLDEKITFYHTLDFSGQYNLFEYEWYLSPTDQGAAPSLPEFVDGNLQLGDWVKKQDGEGRHFYILGSGGIEVLGDNYVTMRYKPLDTTNHLKKNEWSAFTEPQLAEGWIKRVLAGINPFNQRLSDLLNNQADLSTSMLTQAGTRWEGDVALNLENMNDHGLIAIYETVLNKGISFFEGYDAGPADASDALLLVSGYLNDLYHFLGDEAYTDAKDPSIGMSNEDATYGDYATSLFAFKGQVASLLEEELCLLRGRDFMHQPNFQTRPIYNRLFWNYTRGIDSGEVIYSLNYNIKENLDLEQGDGVIDAADAASMYPQGHGDAVGHYLTAIKGYYKLIMKPWFQWNPRVEAVSVLGVPVSVDYMDERKFASSAYSWHQASMAIIEATRRMDYQPVKDVGWDHLGRGAIQEAESKTYLKGEEEVPYRRAWGVDHWVARTAQGDFINWAVGNSMLPDEVDEEGIEKVDRQTVVELSSLAHASFELQSLQDSLDGGLTPLNFTADTVTFDIDPNRILGIAREETTGHFEQLYDKAVVALSAAIDSFYHIKRFSGKLHEDENTLDTLRDEVELQEYLYESELIDLLGQPYPDDVGPGKLYSQGYTGPDYYHYMYTNEDSALHGFSGRGTTFQIDKQSMPLDWELIPSDWDHWDDEKNGFDWWTKLDDPTYDNPEDGISNFVVYHLDEHGIPEKPDSYQSRRPAAGELQIAVTEVKSAYYQLSAALNSLTTWTANFDGSVAAYNATRRIENELWEVQESVMDRENDNSAMAASLEALTLLTDAIIYDMDLVKDVLKELPEVFIAGFSVGGDMPKAAKIPGYFTASLVQELTMLGQMAYAQTINGIITSNDIKNNEDTVKGNHTAETNLRRIDSGNDMSGQFAEFVDLVESAAYLADEYEGKRLAMEQIKARAERLIQERHIMRQHVSRRIQGLRTRNAGLRIFREETQDRYSQMFDLAARSVFLAASAFDYETGLLGTQSGQQFLNRIIATRSLGVMIDGIPQITGSDMGDPGLASILAELKSNWNVLEPRLGINNPDTYGTTFSLRTERYRIYPDQSGESAWQDVLLNAYKNNLLEDSDIQKLCLQIDDGSGLPVPGLLFEFSTRIEKGYNLFGHILNPGDNTFSTSSFANKIFGAGVALEGYEGMSDFLSNTQVVGGLGGSSPAGGFNWLNPDALSATPYIYLIPVGQDIMRTPPLGDQTGLRQWSVEETILPIPFNIGDNPFNFARIFDQGLSVANGNADFPIRKHQAFRAVSTSDVFVQMNHVMDNYTNNRLVGRSVWNTHWKLVIPGDTLLNNPKEGIERFIRTVDDIKLHFKTYSYSGN